MRGEHAEPVVDAHPFAVDTAVEHTEWGPGIVMRHEEDRVVVLFEEVGYKTLGLQAVLDHDLLALFCSGTPSPDGYALIAGTGTVAARPPEATYVPAPCRVSTQPSASSCS